LTNIEVGDILFIDEIHRSPLPIEEILYSAMEDFRIGIIIRVGPAGPEPVRDLAFPQILTLDWGQTNPEVGECSSPPGWRGKGFGMARFGMARS